MSINKSFLRLCLYFVLVLPFACTYDQVEVVEECDNQLVLTITEQTPSACGLASGSLTAAVSGGAVGSTAEYSLNGADFQASPSFTDLTAGSFELTVRQGLCTATLEVTVENAEGLNATAAVVASDCGSATGVITITTSDATGTVSFSLDGAPQQATPTFSGLSPGTYEVVVTDEIGCAIALEATILSTVAFSEIQAIVTSSCAVSGCHAGNVSPDFRVQANITGRAGRIAARTGNSSMPPPSSGRTLSQAQIDEIACWVNDGAPE